MEYTKDLILNVRYDETTNTIKLKKNRWTSRLKKNKTIISFVFIAISLMVLDVFLLTNFVHLLSY